MASQRYRSLADLIAEGEHQRQDFKFEISSVSKIAHSFSAFANTDGGRLLVGVKDNGKVAGVRCEEELYMIEAAAQSYSFPPVPCKVEIVPYQGKTIVIATIEKSPLRPVYAKEADGSKKAYVRIADENIAASPVHLALWRKQNRGKGTQDCVFTEKQTSYLKILELYPEGITLNQFQKKAILPRPKAVDFLATCVHFELVQMSFKNHGFVFTLL